MEIRGKQLDDRRVDRARYRFLKGRLWASGDKKIRLTFDELLDHFANDCMTFGAIARLACEEGVSRERIRQIYNKYFRRLLPRKKTGMERRKICSLKRWRVAGKAMMTDFSEETILEKIAEAAARADCRPERAASRSLPPTPLRCSIKINGKHYRVHHLQSAKAYFPPSSAVYSRLTISRMVLAHVAGIIVFMEIEGWPERIFVIPSHDILNAYGVQKNRALRLQLPVEKRPIYNDIRPRLDWWSYENAWPRPQEDVNAS